MRKWHIDRGKKVTGGVEHQYRKKKKFQMGSIPLLTDLGPTRKSKVRTRGGGRKIKLRNAEFVNVINTKTNKTKKVKIESVVENPANPQLVRRGIMTKGAIVKTELGNAKITSRPSQDGVVNAVLIVD